MEKKKVVFASNNKGKIAELRMLMPATYEIVTLIEAGITEEIEEPFFTFRENALAKAKYVYDKTGLPCFSEDSGLVVPALNGDPGVLSARYAGAHGDDKANNAKLLAELAKDENIDSAAYYTAVICWYDGSAPVYFEGKCEGYIATEEKGSNGFGYDPLFIPEGFDQTFGELPAEVKKGRSHRAKAVAQLVDFLSK